MRIGIDARLLGTRQGGLGRYLEQLLTHLEKILATEPNFELVIFLRQENFNDYHPTNIRIKKVLANIKWYTWREQFFLSKIIKKEKIDLMHFPHWNIPLFYHNPFVVTIHDLLLLHYHTRTASTLGPITYFIKNLAYKIVLRHAIKKSKQIITPSEFTKNDIAKIFNIPKEKITVTHLAPTKLYSDTSNKKMAKPYVLYVGVAYPHKNLPLLIDAWKIFCDKYGNDFQLVLAGKINYFYQQLINKTKKEKITNIIFTNYVSDKELAELYQHASLYIFPSLYEGFGLPGLEAMQYNVPVLSSEYGSLPEVFGKAALYNNFKFPLNVAEIIHQALTDQNLRAQLIGEGQKVIHSYSWDTTAQLTWEIYKKGV